MRRDRRGEVLKEDGALTRWVGRGGGSRFQEVDRHGESVYTYPALCLFRACISVKCSCVLSVS